MRIYSVSNKSRRALYIVAPSAAEAAQYAFERLRFAERVANLRTTDVTDDMLRPGGTDLEVTSTQQLQAILAREQMGQITKVSRSDQAARTNWSDILTSGKPVFTSTWVLHPR
jgi:hypothetical protein